MAQVNFPGAYSMSAYAASFMVIQFDPTMRPDRIIDAAHFCNVFPTETGTIGFERTIGTVKPLERSINFTGIVQHNTQTKAIGQAIAEKLALHVHNYDATDPHKLDIDQNLSRMGYEWEMTDPNFNRRNEVNGSVAETTNEAPGKYSVDGPKH